MFKRIVVALTLAAVAFIVPVVTASPASAAAACQDNDPLRGRYWWAGIDADADTHHRKVLAVSEPWAYDSTAYLWDFNDDNRQKWYMDCTSPGVYQMVLASDRSLCLTDRGPGFAARVWPCGWSDPGMYWEQQGAGQWLTTADALVSTYRFVSFHSRNCLDVFNGDSANGTMVTTWACHGGGNQRWY